MNDKTIGWLPPDDDQTAHLQRRLELKKLLISRTSLSEIENWMDDFGMSRDDELKGHLVRGLLDYMEGRRRMAELEDILRRDRPDLFD